MYSSVCLCGFMLQAAAVILANGRRLLHEQKFSEEKHSTAASPLLQALLPPLLISWCETPSLMWFLLLLFSPSLSPPGLRRRSLFLRQPKYSSYHNTNTV